MKADDARKVMRLAQGMAKMQPIWDKIKVAAESGTGSCTIDRGLMPDCGELILQQNGFKVQRNTESEDYDRRTLVSYEVSWK